MNRRILLRTRFVGGVITLLFIVTIWKLYDIQIINGDFWLNKAKQTWTRAETVKPSRGKIVDRNDAILAMDSVAFTVALNPKQLQKLGNRTEVIEFMNKTLKKPKSELKAIATAKRDDGTYYEYREVRQEGWKVNKQVADKIFLFREKLQEKYNSVDVGIYMVQETTRYYPKATLAAHLIGFVNKEGSPVGGVESNLNEQLKGIDGRVKYAKDGNGIVLRNSITDVIPAKEGSTIRLTVDADIQQYIEGAIKQAYDLYKPKSITAIAADPNTMEILGLANLPTYNPNQYWTSGFQSFFDPAVQSRYEPGSTFKIVTLAAAVEEGQFNPNEMYMSGQIKVADRTIRDHKRGGWGNITFLEGLKRSSNVAFVKLGYERLQANKLSAYIKKFGFGEKTGIELPGEIRGVINVNPLNPVDVATAAFGQGQVAVTPIQQLAAVAAVANGGKLMEPHIVKEIVDANGKVQKQMKPKMVRRVISEQTSAKVSSYLEQVVADQEIGSGKSAFISGYRVAGKTGTAQKVVDGKYSNSKFVVSFIGYAPVENPKIIVYVVADEPADSLASGGSVAAPVFREIVQKSLQHMGIAPNLAVKPATVRKQTVTVPDLRGMTVSRAKDKLIASKLKPEIVGEGNTITQYIPVAGTKVSPGQRIFVLTEDRQKLVIPNMRGLPLRDALEICTILNIRVLTQGQGFVKNQVMVQKNGDKVLKLILSPPNKLNSKGSK